MTCISIIISIIALAVAFWAAWTSKKASYKANQISMGELEKSIRDFISQARRNMEDKAMHLMTVLKGRRSNELETNEKFIFEAIKKVYKSAIEDWLNAYEEACAKYLDGKIDKDRFHKTFKTEIKNIIEGEKENKEMYELIHPEETSHYKAIWEVYKEWENEARKSRKVKNDDRTNIIPR